MIYDISIGYAWKHGRPIFSLSQCYSGCIHCLTSATCQWAAMSHWSVCPAGLNLGFISNLSPILTWHMFSCESCLEQHYSAGTSRQGWGPSWWRALSGCPRVGDNVTPHSWPPTTTPPVLTSASMAAASAGPSATAALSFRLEHSESGCGEARGRGSPGAVQRTCSTPPLSRLL